MGPVGSSAAHIWRLKDTKNGFYQLVNPSATDGGHLDVVNDGRNNDLNFTTGVYSGAAWKIEPAGNGYFRILNNWQNGKSLDCDSDKKGPWAGLNTTGNYSGQFWKISEVGCPATNSSETDAVLKYQTTMNPGDKLLEGEKLVSANGKYQLRGTSEGDFVIEERQTNGSFKEIFIFPLAGPINNPPAVSWFSFNTDCNICIGSKQNKGYCATNGIDDLTPIIIYKCQKAVLTDDGQFILVDADGAEIWSAR